MDANSHKTAKKDVSVVLFESFSNRQKMGKMDAARESASITGLTAI